MCVPRLIYDEVPPNSSTLLREHRAAATIQHAYRGHRKRQAAARKIQNFMRQSRIKLRKMHEQSGAVCTMDQEVGMEDGVLCLPREPAPPTAPHVSLSVSQPHRQPPPPQLPPSPMHRHPPSAHIPITMVHQMGNFTTTSACLQMDHHPQQLNHPSSNMGVVSQVPMDDSQPQQTRLIQQVQQLGVNAISLQGEMSTPNSHPSIHPSINHPKTVPLPPIHTIQPNTSNILNGK